MNVIAFLLTAVLCLVYFNPLCAIAGNPVQSINKLKDFIQAKEKDTDKTYFWLPWHKAQLGDLYYGQRKWQDAITCYQQALDSWVKVCRFPEMIPILDRQANCYIKLNKQANAEKNFLQALTLAKKAKASIGLGLHQRLLDMNIACLLSDYAHLLLQKGQSNEANQREKQSREIWDNLKKGSAVNSRLEAAKSIAIQYCHKGNYYDCENIIQLLLIRPEQLDTSIANARTTAKAIRSCMSIPNNTKAANTYLQDFRKLRSWPDFIANRTDLVSKFAYAVPTDEALALMKKYQPIVEIGAGTGYWAHLLQKMGVDILPFELYPVAKQQNPWFPTANAAWTKVQTGDEFVAAKYPDHTLFMCWPPGQTSVAYNALKVYQGKHLIYIGEPAGIAYNLDDFHETLKQNWQLEKQLDLPQWPGLYESLYIYKRK